MRKDDVRRLASALDRIADTISQMVDKIEESGLLDLLTALDEDEERAARLRALQRLDPQRGDFQHRPNGKHSLNPRWRVHEIEDSRDLTQAQWDYLHARTHREKSDLRRGRRDQ